MKKLIFTAILTTALTACGGKKQGTQGNEGHDSKEAIASTETTTENAEIEQEPMIIADGPDEDTLCVYDGNRVMYRFVEDEGELESVAFQEITVYSDEKPVRACKVKGYSNIVSAQGGTLKIAVGTDTVKYDIMSLPKSVNPVKDIAGKGIKEQRMRHVFKASENGQKCVFLLSAYISEKSPEYVNRLIAAIMQRDIEMIFGDEERRPDLMKEYNKLGKKPNAYQGLNTANVNPKEIGSYFARKFEKSYRKFFADEIKEGWAPQEEYLLETAPVWTSEDGQRTTYRFYTHHYGGGAHGMMNEFYITFNNSDGRILGYRDILGEEGMKKARTLLGKGLDERLDSEGHTADLGKEWDEDYNDRVMNEAYEGYVYPRPAITRNGIVFTYQAYDKGSFADGILHMTVPSYTSKKGLKNI